MLVLARRLNERIIIPCVQTAIQIVGIQGGIIRLGIEAPTDVKVFREEVLGPGEAMTPPDGGRAAKDDLSRRLADSAQELAVLRQQLRGKVPESAAATLYRLDRELAELARRVERPATDASKAGRGTTVAVPAAP
jgi:carbon storage regulator